MNLVVLVSDLDHQNPWELQLLAWITGKFFQIRPIFQRTVSAGSLSFILHNVDHSCVPFSEEEGLERLFKPLMGHAFSNEIKKLLGTENLVEVTENNDHWRTYLALVPAWDLEKIRFDYSSGGFDLITQKALLTLMKKQRRDNKRSLEKARQDPILRKMKVVKSFQLSDISETDFCLAQKAFEIFGQLMEKKKKEYERFQGAVRYGSSPIAS